MVSAPTQQFLIAHDAIEPERDEQAIEERMAYLKANLANGFTQMPDAVRSDPRLSRAAKLVYEQLLFYMRQRDFCWPSQQRIADDLGTMSKRTVIRALKELYERGYIEKWRRGLNRTNVYFVNPLDYVRTFRTSRTGAVVVSADELMSGKCQTDTSTSASVAQQIEPDRHIKQIEVKEIQVKETSSNPSSSACRTGAIGKVATQPSTPKTNQQLTTAEERAAPARAERATPVSAAHAYDTATTITPTTGIPADHLAKLGLETERRRRPVPDFITNMMTDFCLQLGDKPKSIKSSITRATKIYYTACAIFKDFQEDPEGLFIEMLYQAKRSASSAVNVRHRGGMNGGRWNRVPLFFHILEKMFEFTEEEAAYLRSDHPLLL